MKKKINIGFVYNGLPNIYLSGSDLVAFSIVKILSDLNYIVTCIPTYKNEYKNKKIYEDLIQFGIRYVKKDLSNNKNKKKSKYKFINHFLNLKNLFISYYSKYSINEIKNKINVNVVKDKYDLLIVFDNANIVSASDIRLKKIAILGDPENLVNKHRILEAMKYFQIKSRILYVINEIEYWKFFNWLSHHSIKYNKVFTLAHDEKFLFKSYGVSSCDHLHPPVINFSEKIKKRKVKDKTDVILLGDINRNYEAIRIIGRYLIPLLEKNIAAESLRIKIIGSKSDSMPDDIKNILSSKYIEITGYIENIELELSDSDIIFYPINHPVGIRTKIITAASLNCAIVAHSSSKHGIPELKNEINSICLDSQEALCSKIIDIHQNKKKLEKLKMAAKKLYIDYYSLEAVKKDLSFNINKILNEKL